MLFHTPEFLVMMLIVWGLYYVLPPWRLYILAVADALFYAVGGIGYLALFLGIATITYGLALFFAGPRRKLWLWLAILLNVGNLLFFKYTFFILANLQRLVEVPLLNSYPFIQHIILPIGISFYTFELIAYAADVYKEKIPPERSWMVFWVFISFFPHRVAGPIMRGQDLINQINRLSSLAVNSMVPMGLAYLAMGLAKKIIIADYLARWVNNFYAAPTALNSTGAWVVAYLYTFQIYYDFSAYSEMALGIGLLFGVKLALNFKTPYLSRNATEFWKRWHITLSDWIRDYVYIPLGGSWYGKTRKYINLFIAMAVSGLWHGAAWTFVIWGMYHGLLLIIHNIYDFWRKPGWLEKLRTTRLYHALAVIVFFQFVTVGWVFFRVEGIHNAAGVVYKMMTFNPAHLDTSLLKYLLVIIVLFGLHPVERWLRYSYQPLNRWWTVKCPAPLRAVVYTLVIVGLVVSIQTQPSSFIYFQF